MLYSFQLERTIFRDQPTENPLTNQSYVDAVAVFSLTQVTLPAVAMADIILMMVQPMLEP
jgi:hypothetical protein